MTGVLVSKRVADAYGARIAEIADRCGCRLDILVFSLDKGLTPCQTANLEIAFYSRDVWEGTDKTYINPQTLAFFEIVDRAPHLKWLQVTSAGADLPYYQPSVDRGVRVSTSSGSNAEPIAQTALASILVLARGLPYWMAAQRRHEWAPLRGADQPRDLAGQKAVIVGTGPIGKGLARLLRAVGLHTIGVRRALSPTEHFDVVTTYERIDEVLPQADWLVIACPLTETTQGLIGSRRLDLLPRAAHVVNVARGEIVDEAALTDALSHGRLAGAYLDVFAVEPLPADSPLWDMPNVIITPHNCSASLGNHPRGVEIFLRNLEAYLGGRALENEVSPPR